MLVLLGLLGGCGELDRPTYPTRRAPAMPDTPVSSSALQTPAPAAPPADRAPPDACGAAALAHLVGRPRTEIPVPVNPGQRRVVCDTCPVTKDYSPWRLNIFYDQRTGVITKVSCG